MRRKEGHEDDQRQGAAILFATEITDFIDEFVIDSQVRSKMLVRFGSLQPESLGKVYIPPLRFGLHFHGCFNSWG